MFPALKSHLTRLTQDGAQLAVLFAGVGALLGWSGGWYWGAELFSHFFFQYALAAVLATAILFGQRAVSRVWRAAALILTGVTLAAVFPFFWPAPAVPDTAPRLRVLQWNAAQRTLPALPALPETDLLLILEAPPGLFGGKAGEELLARFPHHLERLDDSPFSIALLSRFPLDSARTLEPVGADFPALVANVHSPLGVVRFVGVHPPPPLGRALAAIRNRFWARLAEELRRGATPTVVCGDFNTTVWSPILRDFLTNTRLVDAQRGHGPAGTWPAASARRAGILGMPIDSLMMSPEFSSVRRQTLSDWGSDHLPVMTTLTRTSGHKMP